MPAITVASAVHVRGINQQRIEQGVYFVRARRSAVYEIMAHVLVVTSQPISGSHFRGDATAIGQVGPWMDIIMIQLGARVALARGR